MKQQSDKKTGLLLINLGTPDAPTETAVAKYLKQFLSDPYVIDLPAPIRWILVNILIIPKRAKASAALYQKIWTDQGSPLLTHSQDFTQEIRQRLSNEDFEVELGMRYGNPSIESAIEKLKVCDSIIIFPLFPQYSEAATESAIRCALTSANQYWNKDQIKVIKDFYDKDFYLDPLTTHIDAHLNDKPWDFLLFSYHGLPERQVKKNTICNSKECDMKSDCPAINDKNKNCYRAQCFATTKLLADKLKLPEEKFASSFQSRLGKAKWIEPYTDVILEDLIQRGIKNLAVACPAFVADCLETLEEINIRLREQWMKLGGMNFYFLPCLNNEKDWINAFTANTKLSHF